MKLLRWLLISMAVLAVLVAVVIGMAFSSGVQTWAAHQALAGRNIEVGRVAVGLNRVELDNVQVNQPGVALTLPSAVVDLPLLSAAGKKVSIQKLVAKGWTLDLTAPGGKAKSTQATAAPAVATAAAFQGIFQQLHLPVDLVVDSVELSGEVVYLADPKQPPSHAHVTLTGGGLAAGQEGKFDFEIDTELAGSSTAVRTLAVHGTLIARLDTPRTFSHLGFVTDGTATGPRFPQGARIHFAADALRAATGEHYTVAVDTDGKHLFALNADYPATAPKLAGDWRLNVRDTDLVPFTLGHALATFEATGEGKLEADATLGAVHATGHLHVLAGQLEVIHPGLQALGSLTLDTQFDLSQNAGVTRIDQFDVIMAGEHPVAEVRALQSFEFNAKSRELKVADPAKDLFSFALQGLPLAWAQPFLSGLTVEGSDVTGTLLVSARNGGMHFQSSEPMAVKNFSVARAGQPLAHLDLVTLSLGGDYTLQQGWQAELAVNAQAGPKALFTLQAKAGAIAGPGQPVKATGQLQVDLPGVMAQPAFAGKAQLTGGMAQVDFQASLDEKKEIEAKLALTGLASPQAPSLPTITVDVRAELAPDGQITFNAPWLFENGGRKSDLAISGTFSSGAGGMNLDARVASNLIIADDLKILAAPLALKSSPDSPAPPAAGPAGHVAPPTLAGSAPAPDKAAFWNGVSGHLVLALKKVVYGEFEVNDIAGDLKIGPDALALNQLSAVLGGGGEAKLAGAVNFAGSAPEPYSLKANVAVSDVDSAPLFRALDPSKPPTVEGKFNLSGQVTGSGLNAADLGQQAQGDMALTSKGGIFRGLAKNTGTNLVASGLSYAGNELAAVGQLTTALQEFHYDQINLQLTRDQSHDVQLKDFSVISQSLRIVGTGTITYEKGQPILGQPLAMQIQMGARDEFATLFNSIRKLSSATDELGYAKVSRPIKITGTPAHPDDSDLYLFLGTGVGQRAIEHYLPNLLNLIVK
ncbi:MAG TPA: hypothetical protein VNU49_10535 [Opitutaceae bacterium]|jgi:hypothetical protein|nr:hypothetical protein [Opitutaceae bacterium]